MAKTDHLGEFEQLALLAVLRLGEDAYGARIQEELDRTAEREASISAIYITLTRLEDKGMVRSWKAPPTDERGGKARRYFAVEPDGVVALDEARQRLLSMWDGLETALDAAAASTGGHGA